ncbi:predicted protein, partial [Arabidopsis lyrata subsp. lyrata]
VSEDPLTVKVHHLKDKPYDKDDDVIKATYFQVMSTLACSLHIWHFLRHIGEINYPRLADSGAGISGANKHQNQGFFEELDVHKRQELTLELVKKEVEINKIQESIAKVVEEKISGDRRRIILTEQINAIKKELGVETDEKSACSKFRGRIDPIKDKIPEHVLKVVEEELKSCSCLKPNFDVLRAEKMLDEDHYRLSEVKERILEFIAVGRLRGTSKKIIRLSGPPGVGKTSIGRSIARALDCKFFLFSVGGLFDVAEIKGHRRTCIGAMPGKMVQCLKNVGTENPLVLIDEIDKLGVRCHDGDPASAMLELLDPEQNANFLDHYLDITIGLSKVFMDIFSSLYICNFLSL